MQGGRRGNQKVPGSLGPGNTNPHLQPQDHRGAARLRPEEGNVHLRGEPLPVPVPPRQILLVHPRETEVPLQPHQNQELQGGRTGQEPTAGDGAGRGRQVAAESGGEETVEN